VLYSFQGGVDGSPYSGALVMDGAGNLYGTTYYGGTGSCNSGCGTVFELVRPANGGSWTKSTLYSFQGGTDGAIPNEVIFDKFGNLYGTASAGGNPPVCGGTGCGTVFELSSESGVWTETTLYIFHGGTHDGRDPNGPTMDSSGNLYGTTLFGGIDDEGTVYELYPSNGAWSEKVLHMFSDDCSTGCVPRSALAINGNGDLVGTVCCAVVFGLEPRSGGRWTEGVVFRFNPSMTDGWSGFGTPVFDTEGRFYGTSEDGGQFSAGTAYRLTNVRKERVEEALYSFCAQPGCSDGSLPHGGMILDSAGNLYGTTAEGGLGWGVVYEITP